MHYWPGRQRWIGHDEEQKSLNPCWESILCRPALNVPLFGLLVIGMLSKVIREYARSCRHRTDRRQKQSIQAAVALNFFYFMFRSNGSEFSENQHVLAFLLVRTMERKRDCWEETSHTLAHNILSYNIYRNSIQGFKMSADFSVPHVMKLP